MFKFLHAADIHLDSPLRGIARYEGMPVEEIRLATRRAFDNLVGLAIDERVRFVLLDDLRQAIHFAPSGLMPPPGTTQCRKPGRRYTASGSRVNSTAGLTIRTSDLFSRMSCNGCLRRQENRSAAKRLSG